MKITLNFSALSQTRWYQYLSRFLIGGATTVLAGLIGKKFGPTIGGLFLAFPAIFPAGATLIESHEKEKKGRTGDHGTRRGRKAAALDAAGASMGAIGLLSFALLLWKIVETLPPWLSLPAATLTWFAVSFAVWKAWQSFF